MTGRLQKKCFIASVGFHLLLVAILFIGPAFLSSSDKSTPNPPIDFVPSRTIDQLLANPGGPPARQPAVQPQAQVQPVAPPPPRVQSHAPDPVPEPKPEPRAKPIEPPRTVERDPEVVTTKPVVRKPNVSLTQVTRPRNNAKAKPSKETPNNETAENERAKQIARAFSTAAKNLREGASGATTVELGGQGGGSGASYANFLDGVRKVYTDAWIVPDGVTDDEATGTASVTIARDGTVLDAKLIQSSGNALADQSIELVLRRVRVAVPLPDDAKESQRTVKIKFNVKAKRGLG